jgi:hypothetical protein
MAYLQAPIEMDIYMELAQGIQTAHGNSRDHVLKLKRTSMVKSKLVVCGTHSLWTNSCP